VQRHGAAVRLVDMFERYTEKARRTIFFARYEAAICGSRTIEPPHMLLGILREANLTIAAMVAGGSLEVSRIHEEVSAGLTKTNPIATSVDLPLGQDSKSILLQAAAAANDHGHKHIGTEHLLWGVVRHEGIQTSVLNAHGISREKVEALLQAGPSDGSNDPKEKARARRPVPAKPVPAAKEEWLAIARKAVEIEAASLAEAAKRLDGELLRAVDLILEHPGKVVVTGIGKSGHIARKLVATLCSTGTAAVFLHPAEAVHGDLGIYTPGDPTVLISKHGTSAELTKLVPLLHQFRSPLIGILGSTTSPLAAQMDVVLDASVEREADPNNLAPTASAVTALAIGHALAIALMSARGFTPEEFGRFHPGGQLGRNLRLPVSKAMHEIGQVAVVAPETGLKDVIIAMTRRPLGGACVVDAEGKLAGIITDGDLRRALTNHDDVRQLRADQAMTAKPVSIGPNATLAEALELMERRPSQISVLPVVEEDGRAVGLLRLHDIYLR
jgi:arabinose-5-phosphate isomerase